MFGRAIWDRLPECIFEILLGQFQNVQKSRGSFIPKITRTKRDYWLITANQQTLCIETNLLTARKCKSVSGQLQYMSITIDHVINNIISTVPLKCNIVLLIICIIHLFCETLA